MDTRVVSLPQGPAPQSDIIPTLEHDTALHCTALLFLLDDDRFSTTLTQLFNFHGNELQNCVNSHFRISPNRTNTAEN